MKKLVFALVLGLLIGSASTAIAASNDTVQATFAKFALKINGESKKLKTDPLVVDGTSYLPVREISELVGYDVSFEDGTILLSAKKPGAGSTGASTSTQSKGDGNVVTINQDWIGYRELATDKNIKSLTSGAIVDDEHNVVAHGFQINENFNIYTDDLPSDRSPGIIITIKSTGGPFHLLISDDNDLALSVQDLVKYGILPAQ